MVGAEAKVEVNGKGDERNSYFNLKRKNI